MACKLIVANWKMNASFEQNAALLSAVSRQAFDPAVVAICVPYPYFMQCGQLLSSTRISLGAQNVSEYEEGAFTGEVSARMVAEFGCRYVIVGHSERRMLLAETDDMVARKAVAVVRHGMVPIVCVGESLADRDAARLETVLCRQLEALRACYHDIGAAPVVIAYEPVWAIGSGEAASVTYVRQALERIRRWFATQWPSACSALKVLYGGSVTAENVEGLFRDANADGALVGGASLRVADFVAICEAARLTSVI